MGCGTIQVDKWVQKSSQVHSAAQKKSGQGGGYTEQVFVAKHIDPVLNPLNKRRESRKSPEHPCPTSIIVAFDVTGSMGVIPKYFAKEGLTVVYNALATGKVTGLDDPQLMFMAIGDVLCDQAPLQAGQFESNNESGNDLLRIYLEGGGGGNGGESYNLAWLYANDYCDLDSWKQNRRGILITIGDERVHGALDGPDIQKCIDPRYAGPDRMRNAVLLEKAQEKWDIFHVVITETSTYSRQATANETVLQFWQKLLGESQVFPVDRYQDTAQVIVEKILPLAVQRLVTVEGMAVSPEAGSGIGLFQKKTEREQEKKVSASCYPK